MTAAACSSAHKGGRSLRARRMLLIDTATVPAHERLEFWSESSFDAYLPVQIRSPDGGGVPREDVGLRARAAEPLPDLGGAEHDDADARARSRPATRSACTSRSSSAARSMRRRRDARASPAAGDVISYETSHPVIFRADQPYESLVVRVPKHLLGRDEAQITGLTAVGISGSDGLPARGGRVPSQPGRGAGGRDGHAGGRAEHGGLRARPRPRACTPRRRARRRPTRPRTRAEVLLNVAVVHRGEPRRPGPRSGGDRARELHLDALPAQALRVGGHERVPVDSQLAARALPPRPARPRARPRDDPRDRQPLGPARPAALQPPLPLRVRMLAERASARGASRRQPRG